MATWVEVLCGLFVGSAIIVLMMFWTIRSSVSKRSLLPPAIEKQNEPYDNNIAP